MRMQSQDTHPEAELVQIAILRGLPFSRKFSATCSLTTTLGQGLFQYGPAEYLRRMYGKDWSRRYRAMLRKSPELAQAQLDIRQSILDVCDYFEARHIPFALSGGIAVGIYGFPETTYAVEYVVNTSRRLNIYPLLTRIGDGYLDPWHVLRVDVVADSAKVARARRLTLAEDKPAYPVIAPEDLIAELLHRFRISNYRDDATYNALLGVMKVQSTTLDREYLAALCGNEHTCFTALKEAGIAA